MGHFRVNRVLNRSGSGWDFRPISGSGRVRVDPKSGPGKTTRHEPDPLPEIATPIKNQIQNDNLLLTAFKINVDASIFRVPKLFQ